MRKKIIYSKDYKFFVANQIFVVATNNGKCVSFCSRLESKLFNKIDGNTELSESETNEKIYSINQSLMKG